MTHTGKGWCICDTGDVPRAAGRCAAGANRAIFATVGTVYEDGITLIFNGAEAESLNNYKCNACVRFEAGQRAHH